MSVTSYLTAAGLAVPAVSTDEMREIDRLAIEDVGPNLYQMMENAGRNLALTVIDQLGDDWNSAPIVVLAGTGGNGGGGICAARHLANRGADVTVAVADSDRLDDVPSAQFSIFEATAGRAIEPSQIGRIDAALIVDALIGYGLSEAPRGLAAEMIEWSNEHPSPVVALDVPSGIDSTTGESPGVHAHADITMTLALPKTGLDVAAVGTLSLADIGIPNEVYRRADLNVSPQLFGSHFRIPITPVR